LLVLPFWNWVSRKTDKRKAYIAGMIFLSVIMVALSFLGPSAGMPLVLFMAVMAGIGVSAILLQPGNPLQEDRFLHCHTSHPACPRLERLRVKCSRAKTIHHPRHPCPDRASAFDFTGGGYYLCPLLPSQPRRSCPDPGRDRHQEQ
jgi:hypothetical protein